jgi:hypothetical protein
VGLGSSVEADIMVVSHRVLEFQVHYLSQVGLLDGDWGLHKAEETEGRDTEGETGNAIGDWGLAGVAGGGKTTAVGCVPHLRGFSKSPTEGDYLEHLVAQLSLPRGVEIIDSTTFAKIWVLTERHKSLYLGPQSTCVDFYKKKKSNW